MFAQWIGYKSPWDFLLNAENRKCSTFCRKNSSNYNNNTTNYNENSKNVMTHFKGKDPIRTLHQKKKRKERVQWSWVFIVALSKFLKKITWSWVLHCEFKCYKENILHYFDFVYFDVYKVCWPFSFLFNS